MPEYINRPPSTTRNDNAARLLQDNQYGLGSIYSDSEAIYSNNQVLKPDSDREQEVPSIDKLVLLKQAGEMGLDYQELGTDVRDLSTQLSDISNASSESTTWWQSILNRVPYLGGLIEPEAGRLLLNVGDGFALFTGDSQSILEYVFYLRVQSPNTSLFWEFPLLFGLEQGVVQEAEDIMVGSRNSDLTDFIDAARSGSVNVNDRSPEAVPLLNWMALQAGEQSTDIEENESASDSDTVFAAAISGRNIFVSPNSGGLADNLIESIKSIYELVETAPPDRQRDLEELLEDELLDIIEDDNRWGITDNDLRRMTTKIERLRREEIQPTIDNIILSEQT